MDEFGFADEEVERPRKKGGGKIKFAVFIFFLIFGFAIGLALGFFLGVVSLVNVAGDLMENTTIVIDLDEQQIVDYAMAITEERYGDITKAAAFNQNLNYNGTDEEKIQYVIDNLDLDEISQYIEIDEETRRLLEEAKTHPEQRDISQTQQNFIPLELVEEIEAIQKQMEGVKLIE